MRQHVVNIGFVILAVVASTWLAAGHSGANKNYSQSRPAHSTARATRPVPGGKVESVASLVIGLEERLEQNPDDGKGWLLLAKSYHHLGRLDEARDAYRRADTLGHGDARVAAELFGLTGDAQ